jgi:uncharacterized membrane protein
MASPTKSDSNPGAIAEPAASTIAACLVLACAMQLAENLLPKIPLFPWLKLGLSHLILLPFLLRFGALPATALALSRSLLTWMVAGTPLTSLMVGMIAGVVSIAIVGGSLRSLARKGWLGWVGLGIASATTHNAVQLAVVEVVLVDHAGFYFQLAPLLLWSLVSGTVTALLAASALPFWDKLFSGVHEGEWARLHGVGPEDTHALTHTKNLPAAAKSPWAFYFGLFLVGCILVMP